MATDRSPDYNPYVPSQPWTPSTFTDPMTTAATNAAADPWGGGLRTQGSGIGSTDIKPIGGGVPGTDNQEPSEWGFNIGTLGLALKGLGTIGGLWQAYEQSKNQRAALEMQRKATNINLANQIMAYNTKLEDRTANRVLAGGWSQDKGDTWVADHRLKDAKV